VPALPLAVRRAAAFRVTERTPNKRSIVHLRLAPEDRDRVKAAAKRERRIVSEWLRGFVLDTLDGRHVVMVERHRKRKGKYAAPQRASHAGGPQTFCLR